jgi:tripartite ATP-independent transporter DctP family solute receptor
MGIMKEEKKVMKTMIIVSIVVFVFFLFYMTLNQRKSSSPEYVFTYAENHPEDYPTTLGGYEFARIVEEKTNGRIKIIVQAKGELGDEKAVIQQVMFGGIDFARVSLSPLAEYVPELNILQMPYLYKNSKHMWTVLDGEIGEYFLDKMLGVSMTALSWYEAGARNFYNSRRPVNRIEDMKGLKIRVQESELMVHMVEALGAIAVPLAYGDVYSSLEKGTIDGAENNWPSYESSDHYEVAKYYTIDEHTRVPELQICSRATWDKLSYEDQEIIRACAKESALYERKMWKEREIESKEIVTKKGVEVVELSLEEKERFKKAVLEVYEEYFTDDMEIVNKIIAIGE